MTKQDVSNFITEWMNKYLDTDGYPAYNKYQCVDVIRKYQTEVIKMPLVGGNAIDYWYHYPYDQTLQQYFTRIPNTLTFIPKLGDVIIFAGTSKNPYGHIGLQSTAANFFWTTVFEQNDPIGSACHYKAYNYITPRLLGVLRPKNLV
jgi:hypothetical protein